MAMETYELLKLMNLLIDGKETNIFVGGADSAPHINPNQQSALIFNTDPSNMNGVHWVAVWISAMLPGNKRKATYFDSFGLPIPGLIAKFITGLVSSNIYNATNALIIQPITSHLCGLYCATFLDFAVNRGEIPKFYSDGSAITDILVLMQLRPELTKLSIT